MRIYIHLIDKDRVEKQLYRLKVLYTINKYTYGYCIELHNKEDWKEIEPIFKKMRLVYSLRESIIKLSALLDESANPTDVYKYAKVIIDVLLEDVIKYANVSKPEAAKILTNIFSKIK